MIGEMHVTFRPLLGAGLVAAALAAPAAAHGACAGADAVPTASTLRQAASATLCLLNAQRAEHRLRPLRAENRLRNAARKHSQQMVRGSFFSHDGPNGSTTSSRIVRSGYLRGARGFRVGENLAWGSGVLTTPRRVVRAWMNSPGHRANILQPAFRDVGIGIALGAPQRARGRAATYTINFGVRNT